jgi:outer membrane protein assembly factor BamB
MADTAYSRFHVRPAFARLLLLCCGFLMLTPALWAQQQATEEWAARYDGQGRTSAGAPILPDLPISIAVDNLGNSYATSTALDSGATASKMVTIKYSPTGEKLWVRTYAGSSARAIAVDNAGGVYVTGTVIATYSYTDYLTVRYDAATGTQSWARTYNAYYGDPALGNDNPIAIAVDNAGGVYVTGTSSRARASAYSTVRYDAATGAESWARIHGTFSGARAIAVDNAGRVYVTGTSRDNPTTTLQRYYDTVCYDAVTGAESWTRTYNPIVSTSTYNFSDVNAIAVDNSGGVYVTGTNRNGYATVRYAAATGAESWASTYPSTATSLYQASAIAADNAGGVYVTSTSSGTSGTDFATVRYAAATGAQSWASTYNSPANGPDQARAIAVDNAGGVYVMGASFGTTDNDYATVRYAAATGAQSWVSRSSGPASDDQARALAVSAAGGVFVTGSSQATGASPSLYTVKIQAATGATAWSAAYSGAASLTDQATSIAVDNAGNSYVTGTSSGNTNGSNRLVTIKYSPAGQQLWLSEYSGGQASGIAVDNAGGVYVTGYNNIYGTPGGDYVTLRYDAATGAQSWVSFYNAPDNGDDRARAIAVDNSGGVYVTGLNNGASRDFATVRYAAATGVQTWASRYNGPANSYDQPFAIAVDNSGGVYVTGLSNNGVSTDNDYATVRYAAATGVQSWASRYNSPANGDDRAYGIAVDAGGVYVTGSSDNDYATVRYAAATGAQSWASRYNSPANGNDVASAIAVDNAGGVYVTGYTDLFGTNNGDYTTMRYAAATGAQSWASTYNGPSNGSDQPRAIAVDNSGGVYVTGNSYNTASTGTFTVRYNTLDGAGTWGKREEILSSAGFAVDNSGSVWVTGSITGASNGSDFLTVKYSQALDNTYAFYRAINLNGLALTLDGNAWAGSTAPNYSTNGTGFQNQTVPLVPGTDATRAGMIRAAVYRVNSLRVTLSAVPAGTYQLYAYVWEDNAPETYSLSVNGQVVRANYNSGPAGTWTRLGPYAVTLAATGSIQLTSSGGTANFSGVELWKQRNQAPVLAAIGNQTATVGQALTFTAAATDPDAGQTLSYTLIGAPTGATINPTTGDFTWTPTAAQVGPRTFTVRVTDNGSPARTAEETITVTVNPVPAGGSFVFYRAINLAGPALTLDGNAWTGSTAPDYSTTGASFQNQSVPLVPATDATRAGMIRAAVYGPDLSVTLSAVPAGTYQAYLYVWEDNSPEVYSLFLNGQPVRANYNSGPAGTWAKLGPYNVTLAATGTVQLASTGGWPNFSGVELWQQISAPPVARLATASKQSEAPGAFQVQAYPNPSATGRFTLVLPEGVQGPVKYSLVSVLGQQVSTGQLSAATSGAAVELDLSRQMGSGGIYYLLLSGTQGQARLRLARE